MFKNILLNSTVKLTPKFKNELKHNKSEQHLLEFGNCIGTIESFFDKDSDSENPIVNVRWKPSNLRYAYHLNDLEILTSKK